MADPVTEIRALLMQFASSGLRDMYICSQDWTVFMAQRDGAVNPLQMEGEPLPILASVNAPHLGLFEPACAAGDDVTAGQIIAMIDVLGRKTEVASASAGRVLAVHFEACELVEFGDVLAVIEARD